MQLMSNSFLLLSSLYLAQKTIFGLDEHLTKPVRLQSRGGYDDYIQGLVAFCGVNAVVPGEPGAQEKTSNGFHFFGRFQWSSSWQGN